VQVEAATGPCSPSRTTSGRSRRYMSAETLTKAYTTIDTEGVPAITEAA
jgi:hypothetical protein